MIFFFSVSNAVEHSAAPGSVIRRARLFWLLLLPSKHSSWPLPRPVMCSRVKIGRTMTKSTCGGCERDRHARWSGSGSRLSDQAEAERGRGRQRRMKRRVRKE